MTVLRTVPVRKRCRYRHLSGASLTHTRRLHGVVDGQKPDRSGSGDSEPRGRDGAGVRVAETDLAILRAFCRPYLDGEQRFPCPTPNNEIIRELAENGVYLDIDALRGHLRQVYAKFGVEDGLNPAQKRARLAELVYESGVITGWTPAEEVPEVPPKPAGTPAAASSASAGLASSAPTPPIGPEPARPSTLRGFPHARWLVAAGVAVLMMGVLVVLADPVGPQRRGSADPAVIAAKQTAAAHSKCERGEFCLGRLYNLTGGLYQSRVSDRDLGDNRFFYYVDPEENERFGAVANQSWSASSNGRRDVIVYDGPNMTGAKACLHAGPRINLPDRWQDRISSFRFATRSACNRYEVLAE